MNNEPSSQPRRELLQAAALAAMTQLAGTASATAPAPSIATPPAPTLTPGKPGDFDFLTGNWKIRNRQRKEGAKDWDEFPGEATVWGILGGVCSIEELRIPARKFSGMGLRLLDVDKRVWSDHWVNAKSGVVGVPGVTGSFEKGAGIFISEDEENGKPVQYRGVWDGITKTSCRWSQAVSRDGRKSWEDIWLMEWTRT